jgi:hypothetical protein
MKHEHELDDSGKLGVWRSDLKMTLTNYYMNRHVGPMSYLFQGIGIDMLDSSQNGSNILERDYEED